MYVEHKKKGKKGGRKRAKERMSERKMEGTRGEAKNFIVGSRGLGRC